MKIHENPVIYPDEGMALTNGQTYSDGPVFIGSLGSIDEWREVPIAEMQAWQAEIDARAAAADLPPEIEDVEPTEIIEES